ncbi:MAG: FAD-binding protein [Chloroflexi bacterium]|nr:FAD-binding protein [Chloroflexota bacterium]
MSDQWQHETDVLVAGYGVAGAVTAIVAHDAGAQVLLLEKGKYPGGCSVLAGGGINCCGDVEAGVAYLRTLSGGRVPDELIRPFAEGLAGNEAFIRRLAEVDGARISLNKTYHGQPVGVYPFPGREAWYYVRILQVPGFSGFPYVQGASTRGTAMFKLVMDNVEARGIPVWLEAPARRLVTDHGSVVGAIVERDGREVRVRARRAVVLATGGFEQNEWMRLQFLQGKPFHSMAPVTHTGDGIALSQKAGAALWHMWLVHGSYGFKFPEFPIAFRHPFGGHRNPNRRMPWIVVDRVGRRYMNEYHPASADTNHRPMEVFDPDLPGYPRIPSFMVFDDVGRQLGPIGDPIAFEPYIYEWSKDNSKELDKGWIVAAGTISDLAHKLKEVPENGGLMAPEVLDTSVASWNRQVEARRDPLLRPPGTMMPIATPPFYAATVWPIISNTQGGPQHNERQQVLDAFGQPIPRLYAVGELGSFFGHLYEQASNLGECFSSGRIAAKYAVQEPPLP